MKELILGAILTVPAVGALAQGLVSFDNHDGTSPSPTATSWGLIWKQSATGPAVLETAPNLYGTLLGGLSPGSLAVLSSLYAGDPGSSQVPLGCWHAGQYLDDTVGIYAVPGVAWGGTAFFEVQLWEGTAASYAAAVAAGDYAGQSTVFSQGVGGADISPSLYGMPAVVLTIPEPSAFALAGLGAAALLLFRRK